VVDVVGAGCVTVCAGCVTVWVLAGGVTVCVCAGCVTVLVTVSVLVGALSVLVELVAGAAAVLLFAAVVAAGAGVALLWVDAAADAVSLVPLLTPSFAAEAACVACWAALGDDPEPLEPQALTPVATATPARSANSDARTRR
jgi:hypothetical protein